jgi:hypothetical protein
MELKNMKLPIIIWTKKSNLNGYAGFSFFIFIFIARDATNHEEIIRHESIHWKQQVELLFLPMWIMYMLLLIVNLIRYRNFDTAYRNIVFEREAYANEDDINYPKTRKFWAWRRYW